MDDLISRQQAIDAVQNRHMMLSKEKVLLINDLEKLPPVEPKREKWNRLDMDTFNCNKCGATFVLNQGGDKMHFCPNCGADMREESKKG